MLPPTADMLIRLPSLPLILLAAALALATTTAWAQSSHGQGRGGQGQRNDMPEPRRMASPLPARPAPRQRPQQRNDALAEAIRRVERSTQGRVISAERMQSDGRDINRIKVMDDRGRVRVYTDDPRQRQRRQPPPTRGDDD